MPLLSVVVPAYQVVEWLEESLRSVQDQSLRDLEVVVVDDGSTDGTGELADRIAAEDPRVRVIHQPNAGLAAARNAGTAVATGELLTFADSDDLVVPGAYERLVASLRETGSDLAIGSVERLRGEETFMTPLVRENHREPLRSVRIDDAPLLLADVFACNKVFRRDFWRRADLAFPEGVRYEDQVLTTQAYLRARSFDIVRKPVYYWRVRDDESSITQRRHELDDLQDRISTKHDALRTVRELGTREIEEVFFDLVLPMDLPTYFQQIPGCDDAYWRELVAGLRGGLPALVAERVHGGYNVAFRALIGIFSSPSRSMSASAGRPSVVR